MKVYAPSTNAGRIRSGSDVHHKTCDSDTYNRRATARACRKGARRDSKKDIERNLVSNVYN